MKHNSAHICRHVFFTSEMVLFFIGFCFLFFWKKNSRPRIFWCASNSSVLYFFDITKRLVFAWLTLHIRHMGYDCEFHFLHHLSSRLISFDIQEVCSQIWATLYDYPCLKTCDGIIKYVKECVRVAWGLVNQVTYQSS